MVVEMEKHNELSRAARSSDVERRDWEEAEGTSTVGIGIWREPGAMTMHRWDGAGLCRLRVALAHRPRLSPPTFIRVKWTTRRSTSKLAAATEAVSSSR